MFRMVDLGRRISGAELGVMIKRVAEEQGGKYGAWVTRGEDVWVLGSVSTEQRGGTVKPWVELPYTAMKGRLTQSKGIICVFVKDAKWYNGEIRVLGKDEYYRMVGLTVEVARKPIGWGRAIVWIPIFGWIWALSLYTGTSPRTLSSLSSLSSEHQAQVEKDVVSPLLSRLGDLLKSTP